MKTKNSRCCVWLGWLKQRGQGGPPHPMADRGQLGCGRTSCQQRSVQLGTSVSQSPFKSRFPPPPGTQKHLSHLRGSEMQTPQHGTPIYPCSHALETTKAQRLPDPCPEHEQDLHRSNAHRHETHRRAGTEIERWMCWDVAQNKKMVSHKQERASGCSTGCQRPVQNSWGTPLTVWVRGSPLCHLPGPSSSPYRPWTSL